MAVVLFAVEEVELAGNLVDYLLLTLAGVGVEVLVFGRVRRLVAVSLVVIAVAAVTLQRLNLLNAVDGPRRMLSS